MIDQMLEYNRKFVAEKQYEQYKTSKYPDKKIAIVTCMDTRLIELLPAALGIKNGDVKIIKNAGAVISDPFDSVIRSLLVAVIELGVEEVMIVGHTDCGVGGMNSNQMIEDMIERGIPRDKIETMRYCGVNFDRWLAGFENVETSIRESVHFVRTHPLIPADVRVSGYVMDSVTGEMKRVEE
ncbi:MAG: carbonic anhydrase [Clostridia bacterium]|nr:carbonic anhydrase [Clostridia bacterium]